MKFLRTLKWISYWVQLVVFCASGMLARSVPRDTKSIVLMGDVNYTGGTFVYLRSLARALADAGFRISILMPRRQYRKPLRTMAEEWGMGLFVIPDRFVFVEHLLSLWRVFLLRASRVVISASGPGRHTMALLWSIPTVHIMHSVTGRGVERRAQRLIRTFLREPHRMVGVSNATADSMRRYFRILPRRQHLVSTIYNGVPDSMPARASVASEESLVVTVGHVTGYKNPATWLRTAEYVIAKSRLKVKPRFIWAGDGPDVEEYRRKVQGLQGIQFVGYTKNAEALLANAAVYFQPSYMESFGLSVAQAMSMGVPCVVSDRGGLPELVLDGRNGFICGSDDSVGLGNAILRLLENASLRTDMSREARRIYLERFTLDRWEREILAVVRGKVGAGAPN